MRPERPDRHIRRFPTASGRVPAPAARATGDLAPHPAPHEAAARIRPWSARGTLLLGLAISLGSPASPADGEDSLLGVFYDFEVAGYCALVTEPVGQGFRNEARRIIAAHGIDDATVNTVRMRAWNAALAEWQNRGLGGFRGWCRKEGREAAARFLREAPTPQ